jgi:hypothetical protein
MPTLGCPDPAAPSSAFVAGGGAGISMVSAPVIQQKSGATILCCADVMLVRDMGCGVRFEN